MSNTELCTVFSSLAFLSELKGENAFKIKALQNAARILEELPNAEKLFASGELAKTQGIGKGTLAIVKEFYESGEVQELATLKKEFPETIFELLEVSGLGFKKAKALYENLQISSLSELEYACLENRLVELKVFGEKSQQNILKSIEYLNANKGKVLLPQALQQLEVLLEMLKADKKIVDAFPTGEIARKYETISVLEILIHTEDEKFAANSNSLPVKTEHGLPIKYHFCSDAEKLTQMKYELESHPSFLKKHPRAIDVPPECREEFFQIENLKNLIEENDIRGFFHLHTNYSDGAHTIEEMVEASIAQGLEYMGISDHSKSAFYANGLSEKRILEQRAEIQKVQKKYPHFKIFQGIESDILSDGSLDYAPEILEQLDFVIASIHGQMRAEEAAITERILRAVENPHTTWLGHMTGRLLLGRAEYHFDIEKVFASAAKHHTGIELNSNPYRLDVDWRHLPLAREKKISIGIFPDAHSTAGIKDIRYGVMMARKGGLQKNEVINTKTAQEMDAWLKAKKIKK